MELHHQVNQALQSIATPAQQTPVKPLNMRALARLCPEFKTFNDPQLIAMARAVLDFLSDTNPRWLALLGTSGAGKTMLARAIQRVTAEWFVSYPNTEYEVRYPVEWPFWHWPTVGEAMHRNKWGLMQSIIEDKACVIDEIGAENDPRKILTDKLCKIAERRLGRRTVWTSNLSLKNIAEQLDQRIASRMIRGGNVVVEVDVIDFNLRPK